MSLDSAPENTLYPTGWVLEYSCEGVQTIVHGHLAQREFSALFPFLKHPLAYCLEVWLLLHI
jgi:hypothetical protein